MSCVRPAYRLARLELAHLDDLLEVCALDQQRQQARLAQGLRHGYLLQRFGRGGLGLGFALGQDLLSQLFVAG